MNACGKSRVAVAAAAVLWTIGAAGEAAECQPGPADFTKAVRLAIDADNSGDVTPGDTLEYIVFLCNPGVACETSLFDYLDGLNVAAGIPEGDLDQAPAPGTQGCGGALPDGGTLCQKGVRGSLPASWTTVPTANCGLDCQFGTPDNLSFLPQAGQQLQTNECYFWTIWARVASAVAASECLCDAAQAFGANPYTSHDPLWTSINSPPGLGCTDAQTCPAPGTQCNTCVRVRASTGARASFVGSSKCFDVPSPCSTATTRQPNDPVRYAIRFTNSGAADAFGLTFTDPMPTSGACQVVPIANATCVPDPTTCGVISCPISQQPSAGQPFVATLAQMPPGCFVDIVLNATVAAGASGQCCNGIQVQYSDPVGVDTFSPPDACFTVGVVPVPVLAVRKVASPATVTPSQTAQFTITVENTGTAAATGCNLVDTVNAAGCMTLVSCGAASIPITCNPPSDLSSNGPFDVAAGGSQTIAFTVQAGATLGACLNSASVTCSNAQASGSGSLDIQSTVICDLDRAAVTFPPVNPPHTGSWVYTAACTPLNVLPGPPFVASISSGTDLEPYDGPPGNLVLYEMSCGCSQRFVLIKNTGVVPGQVRLEFN